MAIAIFPFLFLVYGISLAESCQIEKPANSSPGALHKHIVGSCTFEERSAWAVSANEVLTALENGSRVDLLGVVVNGNLSFDQLPLRSITQYPIPSSRVIERLKGQGIEEIRVIPGTIRIRESWVQGIFATNMTDGALVIFGQVEMDKTRFKKSLDFSRTIFLEALNFSGATIDFEGFFIGAHFEKDARFDKTAFGTHTRFHRAFFGEKAMFNQAGFFGLAEFLQVVFAGPADFSNTIFKAGTGFSGSQFRGALDFSQAIFEREAYFRFARLQKRTSFKDSTFQDVADFTNVTFQESPDFSNTTFKVTPNVGDSKINLKKHNVRDSGHPTSQMAIFVGLFLLTVFFVWRLKRTEK